MDLRNAQRQYDNQEPDMVDPSKAIQERINEITQACREKGFLSDGGSEYLAARHVHDCMDFAVIYSIIQNACSMGDEELGKFVKTVVTKAIETAATNDIETGEI